MKITIDGETNEVDEFSINEGYYLTGITLEDGREFSVAESSEVAGRAARKYWEDLAHDDPAEFRCMVGDENIIQWALGEYAGPGTTKVNSLDKWLDLFLNVPEEEWATYDGVECEFEADEELAALLEFDEGVAYRRN